jgi:hypothetical protein
LHQALPTLCRTFVAPNFQSSSVLNWFICRQLSSVCSAHDLFNFNAQLLYDSKFAVSQGSWFDSNPRKPIYTCIFGSCSWLGVNKCINLHLYKGMTCRHSLQTLKCFWSFSKVFQTQTAAAFLLISTMTIFGAIY